MIYKLQLVGLIVHSHNANVLVYISITSVLECCTLQSETSILWHTYILMTEQEHWKPVNYTVDAINTYLQQRVQACHVRRNKNTRNYCTLLPPPPPPP